MSFPVVDVQIEPAYAVKVVVDMSNSANWPEADQGYANDAWVNDKGAIALFGIAGSNFGAVGTKYAGVWPLALAGCTYLASYGPSGIFIGCQQAQPIDFYINGARVGGFDPSDGRLDANYKHGTDAGATQDVAIPGGPTLHFRSGLFIGAS